MLLLPSCGPPFERFLELAAQPIRETIHCVAAICLWCEVEHRQGGIRYGGLDDAAFSGPSRSRWRAPRDSRRDGGGAGAAGPARAPHRPRRRRHAYRGSARPRGEASHVRAAQAGGRLGAASLGRAAPLAPRVDIIATGRRPQDHGVFDFVEITPDGKPTPITSTRRRVPALWNLASTYGRTSGFIGWYASYPAEEVKGFTVSDRLAFHQVKSARATRGATYPESLAAELRKELGEPAPDLAATKRRFLGNPERALDPRRRQAAGGAGQDLRHQRALPEDGPGAREALFDRHVGRLLRRHRRLRPPLHGGRAAAPSGRVGPGLRAFSSTVDRYYAYQDEVLAGLLDLAGPRTVTLVVSDHGFKEAGERPRTSGRADTGLAPLWHLLHGVIFVHGKGVKPGPISGATVLDVAPTALALLDAPLSKELPGRPLADAFEKGALGKTRTVEKYAELPKRAAPPAAEADTEAVQKLVALGYLAGAGAGKGLRHDNEGRTAASYLNEGSARAASGDEDGALKAFGKAVQLDPDNASALVYAARIYTQRGELPRAGELLDRAVRLKPNDSAVHLQRAAWGLAAGDLPRAGAELDAAARLDDRLAALPHPAGAPGRRHEALRCRARGAGGGRTADRRRGLPRGDLRPAGGDHRRAGPRVGGRSGSLAGGEARPRATARERPRAHRDGSARSRRRGALLPHGDRGPAQGLLPGGGPRQGARCPGKHDRGRRRRSGAASRRQRPPRRRSGRSATLRRTTNPRATRPMSSKSCARAPPRSRRRPRSGPCWARRTGGPRSSRTPSATTRDRSPRNPRPSHARRWRRSSTRSGTTGRARPRSGSNPSRCNRASRTWKPS